MSKFLGVVLLAALSLIPDLGWAVNTINFSPSAPGVDKSVPTWGVDIAWANFDNVRQSIEHIGPSNVDIARVLVYFDEPLVNNGGTWELNSAAKAKVDNHLNLAAMVGNNIPLTFGTGGTFSGEIDGSYLQGGGINVTQYTRAIKATQEYINSKAGFTGSLIWAIEPFNEPDYLIDDAYANPTDLNSVITQLKTYTEFQNTYMMSPSVLNSDEAQWWYDQVPQATAGSSHLLAGSMTTWTNFIAHVKNDGNPFMNPELHSMAEILIGADRGMDMGMVWADVLRGRGKLIQASMGDRLAYGENLPTNSAGAVYRAPDGKLYAFAGGVERDYMGAPDSYRFVSDTDVYFNGIKTREFMLQTKNDETNDFEDFGSASHEGAYADIDLDASGVPALDGYRWKIVNALSGRVLEVANGSLVDEAAIRNVTDTGAAQQQWNIVRTRNGYYQLFNANSGRTAEVAFNSLDNLAQVRQYGTADNLTQQWYVESAGNGNFFIRNGNSNKYLTPQGNNVIQFDNTGALGHQWQFVLDNPTHGPLTHYTMQGNVSDSAGSYHATAFGGPGYTTGPTGAANSAVNLDGNNDYLSLPSGAVSSADLTVSTWVKWDGGGAWQRIFDFGNDTTEYMFLTPSSGDGTMRFAITTGSNAAENVLETDPLPIGEWVNLTLTLGGNTGILYVNGEPQVAGQILLDPTDFNPVNNYIGKSQWPDPYFNGAIADFQIFDYALHPDQVLELVHNPDADGNGIVDGLDFLVFQRDNPALIPLWEKAYGSGVGELSGIGGLNAIPEPTSAWLLVISTSLLGGSRWRRC